MRYRLLIIWMFFSLGKLAAQETVLYDSAQIQARSFAPGMISKYKNDRHFQYEKTTGESVSWIGRIWDWIAGQLGRLLRTGEGELALRTIIIMVAIVILVFFIVKITGMSGSGLFNKRNRTQSLAYSEETEDIHTIPFDEAIDDAVKNGNFRLAVRLLYLQSLKRLTDRGLINWQIDKTNIAYVKELKGTVHHALFAQLTARFENNWYGDLPIGDDEFREVRSGFHQLYKQFR